MTQQPFKVILKYVLKYTDIRNEADNTYTCSFLEYGDKIFVFNSDDSDIDKVDAKILNKSDVDFGYELFKAIYSFNNHNQYTFKKAVFEEYKTDIYEEKIENLNQGYIVKAQYPYDSSSPSINRIKYFIDKDMYDSNIEIVYLTQQLLNLGEETKIYNSNKIEIDHIITFRETTLRFSNL